MYDIYHCCVYNEKLLMMDRVTAPKHAEFYPKNKFDKLVHLVGFTIRIYHDARSLKHQIKLLKYINLISIKLRCDIKTNLYSGWSMYTNTCLNLHDPTRSHIQINCVKCIMSDCLELFLECLTLIFQKYSLYTDNCISV